MTYLQIAIWTANFLIILSYLLVSTKKIKGNGKIYSWLILSAIILYGTYALANKIHPMLVLNMTNMILGIRTLRRLYSKPKEYKYHPVLFHIALITIGIIAAVVTEVKPSEIVMWIGGGLFLSAYALISSGKISGKGIAFNFIYLTAAVLWIIWGIANENKAIIFIEIILIVISIVAVARYFIKKYEVKKLITDNPLL